MNSNNEKLTSICGILGVVAVASYFFGVVLELPVPDGISLLIFFGFPAFGIAQWYLLRKIFSAEGKSVIADLALIFAAAGFSKLSGDLQAVAVGGMNLLATLLGMSVIDKLGRKTLLLIGSVGTAVCLFGVSWVFFTHSHQGDLLGFLVAYIAFFAISQGAVIWVYIGEVFPNRVRAKGQSVGSSSHWIMNDIIAYTFPQLAKASGAYPFVFFGAMMVVQFFVVLYCYPETKGHSLEEMQQRLGIE